jgi:hypothetical protein
VILYYRRAVTDRACVRRCVKVAAVVGTILTLINHGDTVLAGDVTPLLMAKICLNYVVPFLVCSAGFASALYVDQEPRGPT